MTDTWLRGAYPVTPTDWPRDRLLAVAGAVLAAGPALLQYRAKPAPDATLADALKRLCDTHGVPLIINDDLELAARLGTGAHLGRDDADLAGARARLGPEAVIGVSVYDDLDRARRAEAAGASYVSFGRFFPSVTKPRATPARPDILGPARSQLSVPIAVIGGITAANASPLITRGADLLACVDGIFGAVDPGQAVRELNFLLSQT